MADMVVIIDSELQPLVPMHFCVRCDDRVMRLLHWRFSGTRGRITL